MFTSSTGGGGTICDVSEGQAEDMPGLGELSIAAEDIALDANDEAMWVDLRPYLTPEPPIALKSMSVSRIFRMFRSLGVRHLCVVEDRPHLVGIISRKDVIPSAISETANSERGRKHYNRHFLNDAHIPRPADSDSEDDVLDGLSEARVRHPY